MTVLQMNKPQIAKRGDVLAIAPLPQESPEDSTQYAFCMDSDHTSAVHVPANTPVKFIWPLWTGQDPECGVVREFEEGAISVEAAERHYTLHNLYARRVKIRVGLW